MLLCAVILVGLFKVKKERRVIIAISNGLEKVVKIVFFQLPDFPPMAEAYPLVSEIFYLTQFCQGDNFVENRSRQM
jgi:hypothetical protein